MRRSSGEARGIKRAARRSSFLLLLALASTGTLISWSRPANGSPWKRIKESGGVSVYSRDNADSALHELKAMTEVSGTVEALERVISDVRSAGRWLHAVKEVRVLRGEGDGRYTVYLVWHAPWPASDRDEVVKTRVVRSIGRRELHVTLGDSRLVPEGKRRVRFRKMECLIEGQRLGPERMVLQYRFRIDLGGSLPKLLSRAYVATHAMRTVSKLRELTEAATKQLARLNGATAQARRSN